MMNQNTGTWGICCGMPPARQPARPATNNYNNQNNNQFAQNPPQRQPQQPTWVQEYYYIFTDSNCMDWFTLFTNTIKISWYLLILRHVYILISLSENRLVVLNLLCLPNRIKKLQERLLHLLLYLSACYLFNPLGDHILKNSNDWHRYLDL